MTGIKIIKSVYSQIDFNNLLYKYRSGNTLDFRSIPNANKLFDETWSSKIAAIRDSTVTDETQ